MKNKLAIEIFEEFLKWEDNLSNEEHDKIGSTDGKYRNIKNGVCPFISYYIKKVLK